MNISSETQDPSNPPVTGVNVCRRDGKPRRRFSKSERLILLGGHEAELEVFAKLFAPRRCPHIIQRRRNGVSQRWRTVNHPLTDDPIVRHLLANQLQGVDPIWVGTRAFDRTKFVTIDVDFHGDAQDFVRRCNKVERALYVLGVPRRSWLIQPTPSGGRHFTFFPRRSVPTWEIRLTFELVGLAHTNGQHEVYPSEDQGLRLPFGWIPGQAHDPTAWVSFVHDYVCGRIRRANWDRCKNRAERYAQRQADAIAIRLSSSPRVHLGSAVTPQKQAPAPAPMGIPKAERVKAKQHGTTSSKPRISPKDIDDLWQRGIAASGTRTELTKTIAWNFIFARGMPEKEAADTIVEWVYRTGKDTSRDVRADLANNTQNAAEQTRTIVAWCAARRREGGASGSRRFSTSEISTIVKAAADLPEPVRSARVRFAIDFLNFAKTAGVQLHNGWECCPSVRGVIRKWRGCSAMRYRAHVAWAIEVGLIKMTREKWQSKAGKGGRARTFVICVPASPFHERAISYSGAIEWAAQQLAALDEGSSKPARESTEVTHI
jgi:hypothetical protein